MIDGRDLTKEAPRSANELLGGYKILARMIDKCRATINGTNGEYNFNCGVDKMLEDFKGINSEEFRQYVASGASDEEILEWMNTHGVSKTDEEIKEWSDNVDPLDYGTRPGKEWFQKACQSLGLDPNTTSLFSELDADDKASFQIS